MKKIILTLFVLLSIGIFANDEIISELKGLNAEYEDLVKDYSKYLSQINEKIAENTEIVSNFEKIQKIR